MDTRRVLRREYMAQLNQDDATQEMALCRREAEKLVKEGKLMTAALYRYGRQLFLYTEALENEVTPETFLSALDEKLAPWPQGGETVKWVRMIPVFWHAEPQNADEWRLSRPRQRRRGRIALLKEDELAEYVCHHFALTREGVFKGDKYMFISLYGRTLFSYFEEPRSSDNVLKTDTPSQAIKGWMETDPDSHFEHFPESKGQNFLLIDACFDVGEE